MSKFKIGDSVVLINDYLHSGRRVPDVSKGKIYKVIDIGLFGSKDDSFQFIQILTDTGNFHEYWSDNFELATHKLFTEKLLKELDDE